MSNISIEVKTMKRPKKQYTVQLEDDVISQIDKLAKNLGLL